MTIPVIYDPRYHTWDTWASLMVEAYAAQQLSIPGPEEEWRRWAGSLLAIDVFVNEATPDPGAFSTWQDWAAALVGTVNGPTQ